MSEVAGVVHRLQDGISPGYGFTAIIIAYLAALQSVRVVVASILFGALILAGREIQPSGVPAMIQGIVLFCVIGSDILVRYRVRFQRVRRWSSDGPRDHPRGGGGERAPSCCSPPIGEIFAERAGVMNLGVEGMMFVGALAGFTIASRPATLARRSCVAMLAGGLLSLLHAIVCIHFRADQVVSAWP